MSVWLLLLTAATVAEAAPRSAATPLAKPKPGVEACEQRCDADFQRCESLPKATVSICFDQRRLCLQRCDPAALSTGTTRRTHRDREELLAPAPKPLTKPQRCVQGCEERRRICLQDNDYVICNNAENLCDLRCKQTGSAEPKARRR